MSSPKIENIVFLMLVVLLTASCGDTEDPATDRLTSAPAQVEVDDTPALPETKPTDDRLNREYLAGEWCAREPERPESGTTWIFTEEGTIRVGKGDTLVDAGDVETFRRSGEVVSVEPDAFVVSQVGTEIRFERGPCSN